MPCIFFVLMVKYIPIKENKMFNLQSNYKPTGDQPNAIKYLSEGIKSGKKFQTLLGVTRKW